MTEHHWSYDLLKELISKKDISLEELEELKASFVEEIGSVRRYACIKTVEDLLEVLEKRDEINESKVQALREIGDILEDQEIADGLTYYSPVEDGELENEYALKRLREEMQEQLRINQARSQERRSQVLPEPLARIPNNPVDPYLFAGKKREAIYRLISTEIGRKWRDFGREIGIREGEMDNLETDFPRDSKQKVRKMLELYEDEEREDPRRIVLRICDALDTCRRRDLSRKVQEIMTR